MKHMMPLLLAAALFGAGSAEAAYTLHIDGRDDQSIEADLMLPLRAPAEALGYTVTWSKDKTVVAKGGTELAVSVGSTHYALTRTQEDGVVIDGSVDLPAPYLKDGVTYVPAELFSHLLEDGQTMTTSGETAVTGGGEVETMPGAEAMTETAPEGTAETAPVESAAEAAAEAEAPAEEAPAVGLANPFQDYSTLEEAEAAAGVSMTLPEAGSQYNSVSYRAISGTLLEVIYGNDGEEALRLRKGTDRSNVSGDYNTYPTIKTIRVDDVNVRMKGSGNRMSLATWERDGHAYAASAKTPLTIAEMMDIVRGTV